jgi:RNA polymerase sigma-70 factor (ECF subfamily)
MKVIQLHKNESKLIDKAVKNNRKAQHMIYELYASKMLSVCRYYIKDISLAEEVMLNGFFKVFKYLKSFKNEGSFEGWIRRIMVRECISELRKKQPLVYASDDLEVHDNFHDNINSSIAVNEIQQIIDELPEGYKLVFVMYAIEGYKHQEIAEILGISEGTSKSQLFKSRQFLQEKIKKLNQSNYGSN